ncbi:hypothetical protein BC628DRAFT_1186624 [Trametes gibbosa]|nr:hypothetical protein BC628DRAFT_1186624 [Trametes gibbosa]
MKMMKASGRGILRTMSRRFTTKKLRRRTEHMLPEGALRQGRRPRTCGPVVDRRHMCYQCHWRYASGPTVLSTLAVEHRMHLFRCKAGIPAEAGFRTIAVLPVFALRRMSTCTCDADTIVSTLSALLPPSPGLHPLASNRPSVVCNGVLCLTSSAVAMLCLVAPSSGSVSPRQQARMQRPPLHPERAISSPIARSCLPRS